VKHSAEIVDHIKENTLNIGDFPVGYPMGWRTHQHFIFGGKFNSDYIFPGLGTCRARCRVYLKYSAWQFWGNKSIYTSLGTTLLMGTRPSPHGVGVYGRRTVEARGLQEGQRLVIIERVRCVPRRLLSSISSPHSTASHQLPQPLNPELHHLRVHDVARWSMRKQPADTDRPSSVIIRPTPVHARRHTTLPEHWLSSGHPTFRRKQQAFGPWRSMLGV